LNALASSTTPFTSRSCSAISASRGRKAGFVSDHLDQAKRREWRRYTWPKILRLAREKLALLLFGDEASFPQWGTLSYTWGRRGQQPLVPTSGVRKGYKVLGLIDYFTGRLFYQGWEGRLNSDAHAAFLRRVLEQTDQHLVLVQDGARYHTSAAMKSFFEQRFDGLLGMFLWRVHRRLRQTVKRLPSATFKALFPFEEPRTRPGNAFENLGNRFSFFKELECLTTIFNFVRIFSFIRPRYRSDKPK